MTAAPRPPAAPTRRAATDRQRRGALRRPAHRAPRRGLSTHSRRRAFAVLLAMTVAFAAIAARLAYIQGPGAGRYLAVGRSEWTHTVTLAGTRGSIVDANGDELAMSIPQTTLYADPHQVTDPRGEASVLSGILGLPEGAVRAKLTSAAGFVYIARTVDGPTAARVSKADLAGVYSLQEPKRFYPAGQLAQPLIGVVGTDGSGLGGLESKYNADLEGQPGKLIEQTDPQGRQLPGGLQQYQAPRPGRDLVLTLDQSLQYDAEQALAQAIVAANARSGIALLMDSRTGDILADANLTMPDPSIPSTVPAVPISIPSPATPGTTTGATTGAAPPPAAQLQPVEAPSASAFTQVYEPGSVNKLITVSAALESGVIRPSDTFTIPDSYPVGGTTFHDAELHGTKHWTVTDILTNSSNIGTIQIAQKLGRTNLLRYISAFGEKQKTAIDFPGESRGLLPSYWSGTSIADIPIGQGIGVTAMQMLAAYNTIANDGVYVAPRLVQGTIGADGREQAVPVSPGHRVVSSAVAAQMTTMLDEVVRVGTGTAANLSPYTVAGKTGTALMPLLGGYVGSRYVASFAGFVPAEHPAITAMVVVNDTPDFGASASAPTFATIARDALQERKIPPSTPVPPAPGVPLATPETATGAGEVAGAPLPGLVVPAVVQGTGAAPTTPVVPAPGAQAVAASGPGSPARPQPTVVASPPTTTAARTRGVPGAAAPQGG